MPDGANFATAPYETMSASALADQPAVLTQRDVEPTWWPKLYNHVERRRRALITWRWSWLLHWQVLAAFFMPRRWQWLTIVANRMWRGAPINDQIINSYPLQAARICAAGLWTGLMSPSRKWFQFGPALPNLDIEEDAKDWLEDTAARIDAVMHQSNFYNQAAQMFHDVTVIGTSPPIIYEDDEDIIRVYLPGPGEFSLGSGARLTNDTLYRDFTFTVAQTVEMFRLENCTDDVRALWQDGNYDSEIVVCHAIEPNTELMDDRGRRSLRVLPKMFTYREVYWVRGNKSAKPLSVRGFTEKPFMVARGGLVGNDPYGRSWAMDALGDTKQIQTEELRKAEFIEKGVRPPMGADPELKNEPASILPGRITYMNTAGQKKGFWALFEPNPVWLTGLVADIDKVVARIQSCMFVDLFMAISRMEGVQPRNELELTKRDLERLQQLGPFIELFETEVAGPMIMRIFHIMVRRGMIRPMPPSLRSIPIKIEYQSIMRMAMQSSEAVSLKDFLSGMGAASAAAKAATLPDPLRIVNLNAWGRAYAEATHLRTKILYTDDEVKEHDAAREAAMAKAHQQTTEMPATTAAVQAAHTLSQTPLNNGSVLDQILGGGGGGAPGGQ